MMVEVDSSNIHSIGYDAESGSLYIRFRRKGELGPLYIYFNVPEDVWEQLLAAPSKGKFFSEHIRGIYASQKVED